MVKIFDVAQLFFCSLSLLHRGREAETLHRESFVINFCQGFVLKFCAFFGCLRQRFEKNGEITLGWALNIHIYFEYPWKTVVECDSGISEHLMVDLSVLFYRRENPIASVVQLQALYLITSKKADH